MSNQEYRDANKAALAAKQRAYYHANKEARAVATKAYYLDNKEAVQALQKKYKLANRGAIAAIKAKYRAAKLQRTPSWSEEEDIKELYVFAAKLDSHHVDHIIPLQGELVSGLHVYDNLQLLPASENCGKGNRYTI